MKELTLVRDEVVRALGEAGLTAFAAAGRRWRAGAFCWWMISSPPGAPFPNAPGR